MYMPTHPEGIKPLSASLKVHTKEVQIMFIKNSIFAVSYEDGQVSLFNINKKTGFPTLNRKLAIEKPGETVDKNESFERIIVVGFDCSQDEKYIFVAT